MLIEEILIIRHGEIAFGISTSFIGQILRVPDITPLALSPCEVRGLCALGGNIATVIDINLLLGLPACDGNAPKNRVITLNAPWSALCLLVDEVSISITVDPEKIEYLEMHKDVIAAIVHHENELIQVIDLDYTMKRVQKISVNPRNISDKSISLVQQGVKTKEKERYLVFKMGGAQYALLIDNLREILNADIAITAIAGSNREIQGMMSLRNELIVVADLRVYYHYEPCFGDKNRIIIVEHQGKTLGLVIDEIVNIHEFSQSDIDTSRDHGNNNQISGVIQSHDHLISLIGEELIASIMSHNEEIIVNSVAVSAEEKQEKSTEVVIFQLGSCEYAFEIEEVAEIIDMIPVTPVADAHKMIDGIINIRGQIVTIGSLHKRLGIESLHRDNQKIIICHAQGSRIGFFVNSVSDVMAIPYDQMRKDDGEEGMFSHVLHLDEGRRLVMLFKPNVSQMIRGEKG
ncbi:MAG: chemotaxis protein CheW [Sulfuricurvum sp.]|nr:chemotaxis protein CheW [Sulfuricurvum sp.]